MDIVKFILGMLGKVIPPLYRAHIKFYGVLKNAENNSFVIVSRDTQGAEWCTSGAIDWLSRCHVTIEGQSFAIGQAFSGPKNFGRFTIPLAEITHINFKSMSTNSPKRNP